MTWAGMILWLMNRVSCLRNESFSLYVGSATFKRKWTRSGAYRGENDPTGVEIASSNGGFLNGFPDCLRIVIRTPNEQNEMQDALTMESFPFSITLELLR